MSAREIIDRWEDAADLERAPLLVLEPLRGFLDEHGLGSGPIDAERIGEGQSNVTFLIARGPLRVVLRRPPRPPLPPSAHDMLREARFTSALAAAGAPVPHVLAVCDDEGVLGVPFYVMEFVGGLVITDTLPTRYDRSDRRALAEAVVGALATVHAVDWRAAGLCGTTAPETYLERQIRRFSSLWELNANRDLPAVTRLADWLDANRPTSPPSAVVHGDYRLGNLIAADSSPPRIAAVLDWELATIGDPLADLGYLVATWSSPDRPGTPLHLSPVTQLESFPGRRELAQLYAERTGLNVEGLGWYEALALWKGAIFCEAIYGRYLRGERGTNDPFGASLERGIPQLLAASEAAAQTI